MSYSWRWCLLIAPCWAFIFSLIIAFNHPGYSHLGQHMSELAATYAPYNLWMSYLGLLPHGLLLFLGSLALIKNTNRRAKLPYGFLLISALFFILLAIFPCDFGCPVKDNISLNAKLHSIGAFSAFLAGICAQLFLGSLYLEQRDNRLYGYCLFIGLVSAALYILMYLANFPYGTTFFNDYKGLTQRLYMASYIVWMILVVTMEKPSRKDLHMDLHSIGLVNLIIKFL